MIVMQVRCHISYHIYAVEHSDLAIVAAVMECHIVHCRRMVKSFLFIYSLFLSVISSLLYFYSSTLLYSTLLYPVILHRKQDNITRSGRETRRDAQR